MLLILDSINNLAKKCSLLALCYSGETEAQVALTQPGGDGNRILVVLGKQPIWA